MKQHIQQVTEHVNLYRDSKTGIAWVENGKTGNGHSAHPNIDATGSVAGMKKLGYWKKTDRAVKAGGCIYNIDRLVIDDNLDQVAADACYCGGKHK